MISTPEWRASGDTIRFDWKDEQITVEADGLHKERYGLYCELMLTTQRSGKAQLLFSGRMNLSALDDRPKMTRYLEAKIPNTEMDWAAALEQVCLISKEVWRRGEPSVDLRTVDPREAPRWLLEPFVAASNLSLLFADGGTGKSTLALAMGVAVASGSPILGILRGPTRPVLYCDYEDDEYTHGERLHALCKSADIDEAQIAAIDHQRLQVPFLDAAEQTRRQVREKGYGLVILDSFGMARGANPSDADPTINAGLALRRLGVPVIVIDHVAKAGPGERPKPIGSVYTGNQVRIGWYAEQVSADEEGNEIVVRLSMAKRNRFRKMPDRLLRINYFLDDDDEYLEGLTIREARASQVPELIERMSLAQRILLELEKPRQLKDLADELGEGYAKVKARAWELNKGGKIVKLPDGRYAKVSQP